MKCNLLLLTIRWQSYYDKDETAIGRMLTQRRRRNMFQLFDIDIALLQISMTTDPINVRIHIPMFVKIYYLFCLCVNMSFYKVFGIDLILIDRSATVSHDHL